jgi:cell division transport system permease protein
MLKDEGFKESFGADLEELFGENNPLLDHYEATLSSKSANKAALDEFVDKISKLEGVAHVSYPKALVKELHPTLDAMQLVMLVFGGALLLISFVLLNNTILLDVYSKRELINTLKAVGATKWFIMQPFVIRCSLQGLIAGVIASMLLFGAIYSLESVLPGITLMPTWAEIGIGSGILILLGVIVAAVCTLPIVNHFVNMKSNKIQIC